MILNVSAVLVPQLGEFREEKLLAKLVVEVVVVVVVEVVAVANTDSAVVVVVVVVVLVVKGVGSVLVVEMEDVGTVPEF